jgi:hypothetical protein
MAGRPEKAKNGSIVEHPPTGFPLFFDKRKPRLVTADPWAFLSHLAVERLAGERRKEALAFIEQAFDFHEAGQNPQLGSKPLLYYYSFLNLTKAALLIRKVPIPLTTKHGISDPRANMRTRLRFEGQKIKFPGIAQDRSAIFPEFLDLLGTSAGTGRTMRVIDILRLLPSIHRTYVAVTRTKAIFMPVKAFEVRHSRDEVWVRLLVDRRDNDVRKVLSKLRNRQEFKRTFHQVESQADDELWFETDSVPGHRRGLDIGIKRQADALRRLGPACILTSRGYRFYLPEVTLSRRLPCLAASYASMFYLGSITRYKPHYFDKLLGGKYRWIVEEVMATEPMQFLYKLASQLAGVDVVRPYALA